MRYDLALETLTVEQQRIYEALYEAAYLGIACPTNKELAIKSGRVGANAAYASGVVSLLEMQGLVTVHRGHRERVVILASGEATAGNPDAIPLRHPRESMIPAPAVPITPRSTCGCCGARSDYDCGHQGIC